MLVWHYHLLNGFHLMNKSANKVSCIILAGGEGKRVGGVDKGLLEYRGKPLIEHVIEKVSPQVDDIVISANRNTKRYQLYSQNVISDESEQYLGPLAGIAAALPYCTNERVLIVPCDMPFLPGNLVQKLSNATGKDISIAETETKMQLAFLMHKKLLTPIQHSVNNNQLRLMQWVRSHQPAIIHFTDDEAFKNFNNRDDIDQ